MLAAVGSRGQPQELSRSQYVGASSCRRDLSRAPTRARSRHVVPARRACGTLDISEDFDARMRSEELFAHPQIDMFRPSERRAPSTAPRKKGDMPKKPIVAPRFYDASSGVRKAKAEATEKETASSRRGTPLKYIGCPPAEPRLRPKKTSTGLEERLEKAGGYGVQIHWDEYSGYHVHATPPTVDLMHSDEVLLVRDSPEDEPTWEVSGCRGPRQPLGSAGERDRESSDAKKSGVPPCGRPRRCIPVYRFAPKLCEKSREIIDLYRQERLGDLWKKLDAAGEGVVDFFQLASQAQLRNPKSARRSANEAEEREEIRRGVLRPAGASEKAPEGAGGLSRIEERFVQACLPRLIQVAVSRSSKQILRDGQTLGPHFDASLRFTQAGPRGGLNPPVSVPTEPPIYPYPKPPDPMCVDLAPDAESEAAKLEKENAEAARASKRLARQHNQVVMLNVDQRLGVDASATPSLFVPRKKFEAVALDILAHEFGNSDIDLFRDRLMCECRKLVEKVNPEEAKKFFKPYILEYSRKLDAKRRKAREREREAERRGGLASEGDDRPGAARRGMSSTAAALARMAEDEMNFPSVGLRRVENRFDEQIAHYLRKKQQLRHLKEALDEMPEGEFCTFHPAVNPPPKYLQNCPRRTRAPNDPLVILERFCSQLTEDREYPKLVEAIRECTFQPNIHKFVAKEKKTQQAVVEIQSEAKADAKKCAVGVAQGKLGAAKGRSGEFDDAVDGSPSTQNRVDSLFNTLDQPFNYIFAADIKQWLKTEADNYSASDEEAVEKKKQQGWKRWEVEGRTPQYRGPFKDRSRQRLLAQGSGELVVDTQEVAHTRTPSVAPKRRSTPYNEWVDGLRGGYVPNDMDFHVGPSERGNEKKLERYEMRDWSRYIRLDERAVETRVIPNEEIIDAICESELPSAVPPPPTIWVRRRRWVPGAERGPDAATYTATHFHTGDEQVAGLVPAGKPAALTRQQAKAFKKPFPQPEPTTFVVPTPLKLDRLRQKYRLYMQLRNGTEVGEIRTPPRVVALRKDVLKDIEAEVLREPPSLVLADADGDSSAPSTAETDESDSEAGAI